VSTSVQRQQTNSYQGEDSLYCVTATYDEEGKRQWLRRAISVRNYSNRGQVNGGVTVGEDNILCATQTRRAPGKLLVAPCFLPSRIFGGPYWVVAVADDYSWAVVSGGQPDVAGECTVDDSLCTTADSVSGVTGFLGQNQGLWFFTRAQVADNVTLAVMEGAARGLGICTDKLRTVEQEGCKYEGARIKN
jgi:lipocalin